MEPGSAEDLWSAGQRALAIIAQIEGKSPEQVSDESAQALLNQLIPRLGSIARELEMLDDSALAQEDGGMLGLDAALVRRLRIEFGAANDEVARFQAGAQAAWATYAESPSILRLWSLLQRWSPAAIEAAAVVPTLSRLTWAGSAATAEPATAGQQPKVGEERIRSPGLYDIVLGILVAAFWDPRRHVREHQDALVNGQNRVVGRLRLEGHRGDLDRWIHATEGLPAHELLRWIVAKVIQQGQPGSSLEARRVVVPGGLTGLAIVLGLSSSAVIATLRDTLDLFSHLEVQLPDGKTGTLLTYSLSPSSRRASARLTIVVADALLAEFGSVLTGHSPSQREARRVVPLPPPGRLPPLIGHRASYGAQAALQVLVLREMRRQARTMEGGQCVQIPIEKWRELAAAVGVKESTLPTLIERWVTGDEKTPPFLSRPIAGATDVFALGESYATERDLIMAGGRAERRGKGAQKRSLKAKMHR